MSHHNKPAAMNKSLRPVPLVDLQELARRNNESATEHHDLEARRKLRRRLKRAGLLPARLFDERLLDALDRLEAERVARPTRAVGVFLPK